MDFSQRKGLKAVRTVIQKDDMDTELRMTLWNMLFVAFFDDLPNLSYQCSQEQNTTIRRVWVRFFGGALDELPPPDYFTRDCKTCILKESYNIVYDFLESFLEAHPRPHIFVVPLNLTLEKFLSAYRIVNNIITDITSEQEIQSIEAAISSSDEFKNVRSHLETALALLSDRKNPDYRNSIKESISAVESLCKIITGKSNATLSDALKEMGKNGDLHPALKDSFIKLYAYASDAQGIRHGAGLTEEPNLTADDAKYMLVSCSAFVNYLISKI